MPSIPAFIKGEHIIRNRYTCMNQYLLWLIGKNIRLNQSETETYSPTEYSNKRLTHPQKNRVKINFDTFLTDALILKYPEIRKNRLTPQTQYVVNNTYISLEIALSPIPWSIKWPMRIIDIAIILSNSILLSRHLPDGLRKNAPTFSGRDGLDGSGGGNLLTLCCLCKLYSRFR